MNRYLVLVPGLVLVAVVTVVDVLALFAWFVGSPWGSSRFGSRYRPASWA